MFCIHIVIAASVGTILHIYELNENMATDNERSFEFPGFDGLPSIAGTPQGCLWGFYDRDGVKDEVGCIYTCSM